MVSSSNIQHVQFLCIIIEGCGDGDEYSLHLTLQTPCFKPTAYYWYKNAPTNEEFEEKLRENYSHNITNSRVSSITFQSVSILHITLLVCLSHPCPKLHRQHNLHTLKQ